MKVKIFIIPLIVTIIVVVLVWLVYPVYSNGVDGVKENYTKLKSEQKKLSEIKNKNKNIDNLSEQISSLSNKSVLYDFIPETAKEEDIINNLSQLASNSGLLFSETEVSQPAKENIASTLLESQNLNVSPVSEVKNLETEMKVTGGYEKIKEFLNNIEKSSRSSSFDSLDISKDETGSLSLDANVDFNILKKNKLSEVSVSDPVFSNLKLETKIIKDIINQKNSNNFQLNVSQKGRNNLFQ